MDYCQVDASEKAAGCRRVDSSEKAIGCRRVDALKEASGFLSPGIVLHSRRKVTNVGVISEFQEITHYYLF